MASSVGMNCGLVALFAIGASIALSCGKTTNATGDDGLATGGSGTGSGGQSGVGGGVIDGGGGAIDAGGEGGVTGSGGAVAQGSAGSEVPGCPLAPASDGGGASGGSDGGSASPCPTIDIPPTDAESLHVYQLAEPQEHADLQRFVGQYACGDSPLYRGTFSAGETAGSLAMGQENGVMDDGPVIAALETDDSLVTYPLTCNQTVTGVRLLVVNSIAKMRGIRLRQFLSGSGDTYSSLVALPRQGWRDVLSKCSGCIADFRSGSPQVIDVDGSTFRAASCFGSPTVTPSGHLAILAAPSFDDIMELDHVAGDQAMTPVFTAQGGDMVTTDQRGVSELGPPAPGCAHTVILTLYHVDWYVNRQNPRIRGLRNFQIYEQESQCCDP